MSRCRHLKQAAPQESGQPCAEFSAGLRVLLDRGKRSLRTRRVGGEGSYTHGVRRTLGSANRTGRHHAADTVP